jgi:hypothetical protein
VSFLKVTGLLSSYTNFRTRPSSEPRGSSERPYLRVERPNSPPVSGARVRPLRSAHVACPPRGRSLLLEHLRERLNPRPTAPQTLEDPSRTTSTRTLGPASPFSWSPKLSVSQRATAASAASLVAVRRAVNGGTGCELCFGPRIQHCPAASVRPTRCENAGVRARRCTRCSYAAWKRTFRWDD